MAANDNTNEIIKLYVTVGPPGEGALILRISPEAAGEVRALLDEQGLEHSQAAEFSLGPELALESVVALASAGGGAALATVINTFIKRNAGKRVLLEPDRETYEGYSEKDVKRLIESRAKAQAEREAEWERMKGQS